MERKKLKTKDAPVRKWSCVYKIVCASTGKCYVGHTALLPRVRKHYHWYQLRAGKHHSIKLQRAWDKYGEAAFSFKLLERCLTPRRLEREQYWIDKLQPAFNIALVAGSRLGVKQSVEVRRHLSKIAIKNEVWRRGHAALIKLYGTPEFHKKLSDSKMATNTVANLQTPEAKAARDKTRATKAYREMMSKAMTGRIISAETRRRMSAARKLRPYKPLSEEHRAALSASTKGRKKTAEHKRKINEGLARAWARRKAAA